MAICCVLVNVAARDMDLKVIDSMTANNLKADKNTRFLMNIEFNYSSVYLLGDSSYMVMPLNPFGKSVIVRNKMILDKCIQNEYFPIKDNIDYLSLRKTSSLFKLKDTLENDLLHYVFKDKYKNIDNVTNDDIDYVYDVITRKRKKNTYKLNFILLVGDALIKQNHTKNFRWGLLRKKQLLNPLVNLVLVSGPEESKKYFDIEDFLFSKFGYVQMRNIPPFINQFDNKSDDFEKIIYVFM